MQPREKIRAVLKPPRMNVFLNSIQNALAILLFLCPVGIKAYRTGLSYKPWSNTIYNKL